MQLGTTRFHEASSGKVLEVPVIDADALHQGHTLQGPALLVATDTTVVLPADAVLQVRSDGCLAIELEQTR